jgi:hypothetical protein
MKHRWSIAQPTKITNGVGVFIFMRKVPRTKRERKKGKND